MTRGSRAARATRSAIAALLPALVLAACSSGGTPPRAAGPGAAGAVSVPPEVVTYAHEWPLPGRDYANSRAVTDSPITTATVGRLHELWRGALRGPGVMGSAATTPLILGSTVLVQDLASTVRAFDLATGHLRWEHRVEGGTNIGPNGVAAGWGRLYAAKGMKSIFALDLKTGRELWSTRVADTKTAGVELQPQVVGGLVLVSTTPISLEGQYAGGDHGVIQALDAATGKVVWRFDTIASKDLWGHPELNSGGGAWFTPAVDPGAGIVYWGIANPAPFPGTKAFPNGSSRPGSNLYTDSVVALSIRTGKLLWYRQVIPHDIFDRDHVHTMLVATRSGPVLVSTGKSGRVYGHDVRTGRIRWMTAVGLHRNDNLSRLDRPTVIAPGTYGGVLTPPAWADGVVYVATLNAPNELSPGVTSYLGATLGTMPGEVAAVDASTGRLRWSTKVGGDPLGGATVVGDLVFTGTYQGDLYALARSTGKIVWAHRAPGGVNGWPAVAGDRIVWPIGFATPPVLLVLGLSR